MSWMVSWDRTLCVLELVTQSCPALCDSMDCSSLDSSVHGDSPGKNTGVGCHALFQGIFPIRGSNLRLGNCRQSLYRLNHQGSPPNTLSVQVSYQSCLTLCDPKDCSSPDSSVHGDSPGKNTEVGCHFLLQKSLRPHGLYSSWNSPGLNTEVGSLSLLQGIFPTQGSNPGLPHCRWILYHLSHQGSPTSKEKGKISLPSQ